MSNTFKTVMVDGGGALTYPTTSSFLSVNNIATFSNTTNAVLSSVKLKEIATPDYEPGMVIDCFGPLEIDAGELSMTSMAGIKLYSGNGHFAFTQYEGSDVGNFGHPHCAVDVPFHVHNSKNMYVTTTIYPSGITLTNPTTTADMVKIKSYGEDSVYGGSLQLYGNDSNYDHTITLQEYKLTLDLGGYNVSIQPAPMGEPCYISTTCGGFEFNEYFRLPAFTKSVDEYDGTVTYNKAGYVNFRIIKATDNTYSIEIVENT